MEFTTKSFIKDLLTIMGKGACSGCPLVEGNKTEEFKKETNITTCTLAAAMLCDNMEIKMHAYNIADEDTVTTAAIRYLKSFPSVTKALMSHTKLNKSKLFVGACENNNKEIAMEMVSKGVDPSYKSNAGLRAVLSNEHLDLFTWLMSQRSVYDKVEDSDVKLALEKSDPAYIKALYPATQHIQKKWLNRIRHPKVYEFVRSLSPKLQDDVLLLSMHVGLNNVEMVKYLLTLADPTKCKYNLYSTVAALNTECLEMIDVLNADGRVDITEGGTNDPLKIAIVNKSVNVVLKLMQSEKVYQCNLQQKL